MKNRIMFVVGCLFFLAASTNVIAVETAIETAPRSEVTQTVVVDTENAAEERKDPKLQKWLQGIKPAAGKNYWEKKVVRRSGRRMDKGQE